MNQNLSFEQFKKYANWLLIFGIILIVLGSAAIYFAYASTIFTIVYLGIMLLTLGIFEIIHSFYLKKTNLFFLHMLLGILYILGGGYIALYPVINAITLTLLFALFFIISGIFKLIYAITQSVPHPVWLGINGALSLLLGILIWQEWPVSGLWVIGVFMGIDAIFTGWSWVMLALIVKNTKN